MKIYEGRPDHNEGRLEKELAVYDLLDELEIAYERVDHEALQTIEACREVDETLGISICKNLFLCNRQRTSYYLLLLPGHKALNERVIETDSYVPTVFCIGRRHGRISECDTGVRYDHGTYI